MKVALYIARRYLLSRKSVNIINIISVISVVGVALSTMAFIVVLSVFNGLNSFISEMLSSFDPNLKIVASEGKSFPVDEASIDELLRVPGITGHTFVIEDNVLLEHQGRQIYAVMKGVEDNYMVFSGMGGALIAGRFLLQKDTVSYALLGRGVANNLSVVINPRSQSPVSPVYAFYPRRVTGGMLPGLQSAVNRRALIPAGIFSVQQEIDDTYILVPIDFARSILEMEGRLTSIELQLDDKASVSQVRKEIKAIIGDRFLVLDRYEQHATIYKIMRTEKWSSSLIMGFIIIIAFFNLLGSLSMIIIEKKDDIFILASMGAGRRLMRCIFLFEGWLITLSGAVAGLISGIILVWAQQKFELLKFPGDGSFAIAAYPVELQFSDILTTFVVAVSIGFLSVWYPVRRLGGAGQS